MEHDPTRLAHEWRKCSSRFYVWLPGSPISIIPKRLYSLSAPDGLSTSTFKSTHSAPIRQKLWKTCSSNACPTPRVRQASTTARSFTNALVQHWAAPTMRPPVPTARKTSAGSYSGSFRNAAHQESKGLISPPPHAYATSKSPCRSRAWRPASKHAGEIPQGQIGGSAPPASILRNRINGRCYPPPPVIAIDDLPATAPAALSCPLALPRRQNRLPSKNRGPGLPLSKRFPHGAPSARSGPISRSQYVGSTR